MSEAERPEFSRVYEDYHARVLSYAVKLVGRDEADDVTQDVFVKISRSLHTLADPSRLGPWIYAITLNTVRDSVRHRDSLIARRPPGPPPGDGPGDPAVSGAPDLAARNPEEALARREMIACFLDQVTQLPPDYYEVYVLSEFEQLPNAEIGRRLSIPLGTVKIRLHRARFRLYDQLRRNCRCYYSERGELMAEPKQ